MQMQTKRERDNIQYAFITVIFAVVIVAADIFLLNKRQVIIIPKVEGLKLHSTRYYD